MSFDKFIIFAREYFIEAWKAHNDFLWLVYSKSVIWKCFLDKGKYIRIMKQGFSFSWSFYCFFYLVEDDKREEVEK